MAIIMRRVIYWAVAVNYSIIRFADVLLWAAECEVEVGRFKPCKRAW